MQPTKKLWHQSDLARQQPGKVTVFTYYVTIQEVILNKDGKTIMPIGEIIATNEDHRHTPSPDKN